MALSVTRNRLRQQSPVGDLLPVAFAVDAPRPAARPTLAFLELFLGSANALFSGYLLLGILYPADELVAGQRRYVRPGVERRSVGGQSFAKVFRKLVHHSTGHSMAHETTIALSRVRVIGLSHG